MSNLMFSNCFDDYDGGVFQMIVLNNNVAENIYFEYKSEVRRGYFKFDNDFLQESFWEMVSVELSEELNKYSRDQDNKPFDNRQIIANVIEEVVDYHLERDWIKLFVYNEDEGRFEPSF